MFSDEPSKKVLPFCVHGTKAAIKVKTAMNSKVPERIILPENEGIVVIFLIGELQRGPAYVESSKEFVCKDVLRYRRFMKGRREGMCCFWV